MLFVCLVMCEFLNFFSAECTWGKVDAVCLFGYVWVLRFLLSGCTWEMVDVVCFFGLCMYGFCVVTSYIHMHHP
jgi:hypothetical protein